MQWGLGRVLSSGWKRLTDALKGSVIAMWGFYWDESRNRSSVAVRVVIIQVRAGSPQPLQAGGSGVPASEGKVPSHWGFCVSRGLRFKKLPVCF